MTLKFRPQYKCIGKYRYRLESYNWCERRFIDSHIKRVGGQLHYLASHSPSAIAVKWQPVANRFFTKYKKL